MALSPKPTETELLQLIEDQVLESQSIDYKLDLSINNDEEKKEFLADVVSFANTVGGHLIIGMKEDRGAPIALEGIRIDDPDKIKLRLEEIIRGGIAQRIAGVSIQVLQLKNGNSAVAIYVPKSLSVPHMVSFKNSSRFFARHSGGKYQLDIPQIRQAFLLSESIEQKIRDFRLDRIAKLAVDDTPVVLQPYPKIVVHSIPLSAYQVSQVIELAKVPMEFLSHSNDYRFNTHRFNLDGVLFYEQLGPEKIITGYKQFFRNGNFEYVNADVISPWTPKANEVTDIPSPDFEIEIIRETYKTLGFQKAIGIEPPVFVLIGFVGVKGLKIGTRNRTMSAYNNHGIDRNILLIPEAAFESYPSDLHDVASLLRPAFDAIWNAAGWPYSINYNQDGKWMPEK